MAAPTVSPRDGRRYPQHLSCMRASFNCQRPTIGVSRASVGTMSTARKSILHSHMHNQHTWAYLAIKSRSRWG
jgi:hypothetical protein